MRHDLPSGTVTFLFTDVEGSTRLLHELGAEAYAEALAEHRRVIREACAATTGVEVDTQGDAFFFAFPTAPGAVAAAGAMTEALALRADPGARRPAHGDAASHRGGLRRRRRPLRCAGGRLGARRPGRPLRCDRRARRAAAADRPRRAPAEGHRRSGLDLPARRRLLPAAQDDLEHEPPASGELLRRPRRRARRRCSPASRTARASSR